MDSTNEEICQSQKRVKNYKKVTAYASNTSQKHSNLNSLVSFIRASQENQEIDQKSKESISNRQ